MQNQVQRGDVEPDKLELGLQHRRKEEIKVNKAANKQETYNGVENWFSCRPFFTMAQACVV